MTTYHNEKPGHWPGLSRVREGYIGAVAIRIPMMANITPKMNHTRMSEFRLCRFMRPRFLPW